MNCPRCHGLMVSVTLEDAKSTLSREPIVGWRCVLCGEVCDPVIEENRKAEQKPLRRKLMPRVGGYPESNDAQDPCR